MRRAAEEPEHVKVGQEKAHTGFRVRLEPEEAFAALAGRGV